MLIVTRKIKTVTAKAIEMEEFLVRPDTLRQFLPPSFVALCSQPCTRIEGTRRLRVTLPSYILKTWLLTCLNRNAQYKMTEKPLYPLNVASVWCRLGMTGLSSPNGISFQRGVRTEYGVLRHISKSTTVRPRQSPIYPPYRNTISVATLWSSFMPSPNSCIKVEAHLAE